MSRSPTVEDLASPPDVDEKPELVFELSAEEHLRLLQLTTRQAMAARRLRGDSAGIGASEDVHVAPLQAEIPEHWRLVPEDFSPHPWQRECLPLWLQEGRGTVKVATGGGKTLFALYAAQELQHRMHDLRVVIVVPTIPLLYQWYDEIKRGSLPASVIGLMGAGHELAPAATLRVVICVLNSARDRLAAFVASAGWADNLLLIVDECHRASASQAQRIFDARPTYALGLSATPERDAEAEGLPTDEAYEKSIVGQKLGRIIFDFTLQQSLAAGLLTPFEVWHIGLPLAPPEAHEHARLSREITELRKALQVRHRKLRSKQSFLAWCQTQASHGGPVSMEATRFIGLANRRKRLLYRAKSRTDIALAVLSESATDPASRAIVFHESIGEIEILFLAAEQRQLPVVLEHSQLPDGVRADNIDAFRRGVARIIISAKSLVEGFNVPSADLGVIAASSGSVRQRIQSLGRMLRRKAGTRSARVIVLYVRDTEDEAIYEKADWESIVGSERNRYFRWTALVAGGDWYQTLEETAKAPRVYRRPSWEVDDSELRQGDPYPGQTTGTDLRLDQAGNLRTEDGTLVPAPPDLRAAIQERSAHHRARRTPAGHVIVRVDPEGPSEADWRYLGRLDLPEPSTHASVKRLRIRSSSGRRVIALEDGRDGAIHFALGPDAGSTPEGGQIRDHLLAWTKRIEAERGTPVREIFWDGESSYWLELSGEKVRYDGPYTPLEFKT